MPVCITAEKHLTSVTTSQPLSLPSLTIIGPQSIEVNRKKVLSYTGFGPAGG